MAEGSKDPHFHGEVTQKAVLFNADGDVLLVRSAPEHPWSIPGGRIHEGERPTAGLAREIAEETGLTATVGAPVATMTDAWVSDDGDPLYTVVYSCETTDRGVTLNQEHDEYTWVAPDAARDRLHHDGVRRAVDRAIARRG
ncbi:MAG: NUDIX domain-containing protein [Halobacteriaceae archaeon]